MDEGRPGVSWRKFYVHLSGRAIGADRFWVSKLQNAGQTEVNSPEDSDYILLFCPIASRVGTDISEALEKIPAGDKPVILVVMHHTFNRDYIVSESRRQVNDPKVLLVVDTLFYEGRPLESNLNESAWDGIKKFLGVYDEVPSSGSSENLSRRKFYVHLSGRTIGADRFWVSKLQNAGQTEVNSPEDSDYILLFCPITSRVGTDISEALEKIPAGDKEVILVVMHHTFNRHYIVAESRRQVSDPKVLLVVDTLFFEGHPLESNCNDIAWNEIKKFLGVRAEDIQVLRHSFSDFCASASSWFKRKGDQQGLQQSGSGHKEPSPRQSSSSNNLDSPHVTDRATQTTLVVDTMQFVSASDDQQQEEEMSESPTSTLQSSCTSQQQPSASQSNSKPVPPERAGKAKKKSNSRAAGKLKVEKVKILRKISQTLIRAKAAEKLKLQKVKILRKISQTLLGASQDVDEIFGKQVAFELKQIKDAATKLRLRKNIISMIYDAAEAEQRAASNQSE